MAECFILIFRAGQETDYGRFLASLSTYLTLWISEKLCTCFKFTDEQMTAALSSGNPGLSVLLTLEDMGVINQYDISQLEAFLQERQLLQAVEKIHEYLSSINEEATLRTSLSDEGTILRSVVIASRKIKINKKLSTRDMSNPKCFSTYLLHCFTFLSNLSGWMVMVQVFDYLWAKL